MPTSSPKRYPMRTIELTVANADERTGGLIMNLDDSLRFADALFLVPGKTRISMPIGNYHVFAYNVSAPIDEGGSGVHRLIETDFEVTSDTSLQQFTLDFADASAPIRLDAPPRPVETVYGSANYARVDAPTTGRGGVLLRVRDALRAARPAVRRPGDRRRRLLRVADRLEHDFGDASSSYLYQGLYPADRVDADQTYAIDEANLATVETDFYADRADVHQEFTRLPFHPTMPLTRSLPFLGGLSRTEYVDLPPGFPAWSFPTATSSPRTPPSWSRPRPRSTPPQPAPTTAGTEARSPPGSSKPLDPTRCSTPSASPAVRPGRSASAWTP